MLVRIAALAAALSGGVSAQNFRHTAPALPRDMICRIDATGTVAGPNQLSYTAQNREGKVLGQSSLDLKDRRWNAAWLPDGARSVDATTSGAASVSVTCLDQRNGTAVATRTGDGGF